MAMSDNDVKIDYYPNGHMRSEWTFKDGIEHGPSREWHENGQLKHEGQMKNGLEEGLWVDWHSNGQKECERYYSEGVEEGPFRLWYENGQKESEWTCRSGHIEGASVMWHENGQKRAEGEFRNDKKEGYWAHWHADGSVDDEQTGVYKDGDMAIQSSAGTNIKEGASHSCEYCDWSTGDFIAALSSNLPSGFLFDNGVMDDMAEVEIRFSGDPASRFLPPLARIHKQEGGLVQDEECCLRICFPRSGDSLGLLSPNPNSIDHAICLIKLVAANTSLPAKEALDAEASAGAPVRLGIVGQVEAFVDRYPTPCWARVRCGNGDYIHVSGTPLGTIVKKSKMGFLGEKLFNGVAGETRRVSTKLAEQCSHAATALPDGLRSEVIRGFVLGALVSPSAGDLRRLIAGAQSSSS